MNFITSLWKDVITEIEKELSPSSTDLFIKPLIPVKIELGDEIILMAKDKFHRKTVISNFIPNLEIGFRDVTGKYTPVTISVPEDNTDTEDDIKPITNTTGREFTFENFIVGESNKLAYAAAQAVAENLGSQYNPLFIYGDPGMGKTHLMLAIKNKIEKNDSKKVIRYTKGEQFTNEFIQSIRSGGDPEKFRQSYRNIDVLLIDDIQFIIGKIETQEAFFHTFETLDQQHKQIVIISDRPPKEFSNLTERLRGRFEKGVLADIAPPEFETRIAIVHKKAEQNNLDLSDDICEFIAEKVKNNIRQLEGVLKKIKLTCQIDSSKPTLKMVQNAIRDILSDVQPIPVTVERIISEIARNYDVAPEDILSDKRSAEISLARQVAMYVMREITGMAFKLIGQEFGGKDHTTVIYSVQQIEKKMKKQPDLKRSVDDIVKNIKSQ
jgi:chromosomal replication initiator protein